MRLFYFRCQFDCERSTNLSLQYNRNPLALWMMYMHRTWPELERRERALKNENGREIETGFMLLNDWGIEYTTRIDSRRVAIAAT